MTLSLNEFEAILKENFRKNSLAELLSEEVTQKLYSLCDLLQKANAQTNLTAIDKTEDIIAKHFADSLLAYSHYNKGASVIDIGCGAGFPSLPLAIVRSDLKICALDSTGKKIDFVKSTAKALGLDNISAVCARAEEYVATPGVRESFDHATARAVSRLNLLSELAMPFVKIGGSFVALKAKDGDTELKEAEKGIKLFGGEIDTFEKRTLIEDSGLESQRAVIVIKKFSPTPEKFPRAYAKIAKKPM
ncbi:MAG: 16S rRNA (guanine(527)-N(7))-methyltransferase RsmG [Clostridia bacterium]|nr:16S rRNA (guanine(527)-N(7))-methyltransferase RsmG [Clostridia bacterium]